MAICCSIGDFTILPALHLTVRLNFEGAVKWRRLCILLLSLLVIVASSRAISAVSPLFVDEQHIVEIASHPTWRKLIHYEPDSTVPSGLRSAINSSSFFLAEHGRVDPKAELLATLSAFERASKNSSGSFHYCEFRARYLWLSSWLKDHTAKSLPAYPIEDCPNYEKWSFNNEIDSLSVIFATGYLGNPASFYGHTLLKVNSGRDGASSRLLDLSVNYGALVPAAEDPITYLFKGVLGGYDGGFSDTQYYYHNHNYTELELRDLWEYQLAIPADQTELIVAHAWELMQRKFTYYFFRKNCAYRMAELLELVDGLQIIPQNRPWTVPQKLIQNIYDAKLNGNPLVSKLSYHPSRQSSLYSKYNELSPNERDILALMASSEQVQAPSSFKALSGDSKRRVLDALIDYLQFSLIAAGHKPSSNEKYQRALLARFALPSSDETSDRFVTNSPHSGRAPSLTNLAYTHSSEFGDGLTLRIRPAYYDDLDAGYGHVENSSLVMLDTYIFHSSSGTQLRQLDLINVSSVNRGVTRLPGDKGDTWQLKFGLEQQDVRCENCLVARLQGGKGRSWKWHDQTLFGVELGGGMQNNKHQQGVFFAKATVAGMFDASSNLKLKVQFENRYHFDSVLDAEVITRIEGRYQLRESLEARFKYERNQAEEIGLSVGYYW